MLEFFNADPDEFVVIFTSNATQALKLVGEAYPFDQSGEYLLTFDNHNSVNGIREFARANSCPTTYVPIVLPDMRVDEAELASHLSRGRRGGPRLFAYPAQSNFSGVQHPLDWIPLAQEAELGRAAGCGGVYTDQPPRSCAAGSRTSCRRASTRCSAIRLAWDA